MAMWRSRSGDRTSRRSCCQGCKPVYWGSSVCSAGETTGFNWAKSKLAYSSIKSSSLWSACSLLSATRADFFTLHGVERQYHGTEEMATYRALVVCHTQ